MTLAVLLVQFWAFKFTSAASLNAVVINEVAWAGSVDSSSDEWIELYNNTDETVDLSGWYIKDDGSGTYMIESGTIEPHGYFLIEDNEEAVSNVKADAVIGLSLANSGDSLVLHDAQENVIDVVNGSGGSWFAGESTSKASMEKIDPTFKEDLAENWASAVSSNGAKASNGSEIMGTPGGANSTYEGVGPTIEILAYEDTVNVGDEVAFSVEITDAKEFYAYGFEIAYDAEVLEFVSASEGEFLYMDGMDTAFNYALENGKEGKLIVGNARLENPAQGISGDGQLFDMSFKVISDDIDYTELNFGGGSFASDLMGQVPVKFAGVSVIFEGSVEPPVAVSALQVAEGEELYSLELSWNGDGEAYVVKRKDPQGNFVTLGQTSENKYVDKADLIPGVEYLYQVISVKNGLSSVAVEASGKDERGITGDNDRSERVDGKDLENLARSYGAVLGGEDYEALVDTTYDGVIDGSDLIDIGANFGMAL